MDSEVILKSEKCQFLDQWGLRDASASKNTDRSKYYRPGKTKNLKIYLLIYELVSLIVGDIQGCFYRPSGSHSIISTNDNNNVAIEILAHNSEQKYIN